MKLRNKKTGDVFDFDSITDLCFGSKIQLQATNMHNKPIYIFNSLAELNDEWEDCNCKEEKNMWYIDWNGDVQHFKNWHFSFDKDIEQCRQIGNYFETREEAEKAVEKLKAFKRLKDLGFRFEGIRFRGEHNYIEWKIKAKNELTDEIEEFRDGLQKVFGGEYESNQ